MNFFIRFFERLDIKTLAFIGLFLGTIFNLTYTDADFFWQLKTGQYIYEHFTLPSGDIFSYTKENQPWVIQEWGYELLIYTLHHTFGLMGVKALISIISVTILYINYSIARQLTNNSYLPFFIAFLCWVPLTMGITFRPHMFTYLFFALLLKILITYHSNSKSRLIWSMPILMMLWVNMHAGFIVGFVLIFLFLLTELATLFRPATSYKHKNNLYILILCVFLTLLLSLINPYFIHEWFYPFDLMKLRIIQDRISEWQSPNFHHYQIKYFLFLVLLSLFFAIYSKKKPDLFKTLLFFSFVVEAFTAQRHISLAAIAMIPFVSIAIYHTPYKSLFKIPFILNSQIKLIKFINWGGDLGKKEFLMNWIVLFFVILSSVTYYPTYKTEENKTFNRLFPINEAQYIIDHNLNGRMLNDVDIGGYLIYKLFPSQKVFYDGRVDFYGDKFSDDYFTMINGSPGWDKVFDQQRFDYVLLRNEAPLRQLLLLRGDYKLVSSGDFFSLLLKKTSS